MPLPLERIRVLDFTQIFAGPGTGMYLADQGADVIKIEPPNGGRDRAGAEFSDSFLLLNRGKRSLALDIRTDSGREVVHKLAQHADVMLVAWPPGQAERLGYAYEQMRAINPRLIYANITGWGNRGPLAHEAGYDRLIQAYTGIMAARTCPHGSPVELPFYVADMAIPMVLSYGILLALWVRERTGQGQQVETSQLLAGIAMQSIDFVFPGTASEPARPRVSQPAHIYRTQDKRYLVVVPLTEQEWANLWQCLGLADFGSDERLRSRAGREALDATIRAQLAAIFTTKPLAAWLDILAHGQVPRAPVLTRAEFVNHAHPWENDMLVEVEHPIAGPRRMMALPVCLSDTPGRVGGPAPAFGQHSREVLQELGYDETTINQMYRAHVIR